MEIANETAECPEKKLKSVASCKTRTAPLRSGSLLGRILVT